MVGLSAYQPDFHDGRKEIVCGENKSVFRAKNPNGHIASRYRIDGCIIPSTSTRKCDFLLLFEKNNRPYQAYLVELKGQHVSEAMEQIDKTYDELDKNDPNLKGCGFFFRIVCGHGWTHKTVGNKLINWKKKWALNNIDAKCKSSPFEETIV